MKNLFILAYQALQACDVTEKLSLVEQLKLYWGKNILDLNYPDNIICSMDAGRPKNPILVDPKHLPKRKANNALGRAALMHAIAHIEFNAINLALDAICRFSDMPIQYYQDWLQVAQEESLHFSLIQQYLLNANYKYGDFPAHNGLWEVAKNTAHDVLIRMALVPRVLEARGLDVTPMIIKKFITINDQMAIEILKIIEQDEIGHVAIGSKWFRFLCQQRNLDPFLTFKDLIFKHAKSQIKLPLEEEKRLQAGFSKEELLMLNMLNNI